MQKLLALLSTTLVLACNGLFAQNCPTNPTYKNQDGTYDLTAGRTLVINDAKSHNITITNNFSATSTICVINGSTVNLIFNAVNAPVANGSIYVDATSKLNFTSKAIPKFPLTINNYGTLTQSIDVIYTDSAIINNYGTYSTPGAFTVNNGTILLNNSGTMDISGKTAFNSNLFRINNLTDGSLTIKNDVVFNTGQITNYGTLKFNGTTTYNSISFESSGYVNFVHSLAVDQGSIINYGWLDANENLTTNNFVTVTNYCTITVDKGLTINGGTAFTNYGNVLLKVAGTAVNLFTNNKSNFINGPNGFVQGFDFTNHSSITGGGNFYFAHNTSNDGTFSGSASSSINFYDATNTTGKFFDVESSSPQFTTKNVVTPITATTFTPCGYPAPPTITIQPAPVNLCDNTNKTATFSVTANSPYSSMTYQWRKNGVNIAGATSSSFTASNLSLADTADSYAVAVTNNSGTTLSNSASVHFIIVAQPSPASLNLATGSAATLTIQTSGATAWQWKKNGTNIPGALTSTFDIAAVKLPDAGNYTNLVTYTGGTCTSNAAVLTVENLPAINTQPLTVVLCTNSITSAIFGVNATSTSAMSYQWYRKGTIIAGATNNSYTANDLTYDDTANTYQVKVTNSVGTTTSNSAGLKYTILTQPTNQFYTTGLPVTFSVTASAIATGYQWQKNGANIAGATGRTFTIASPTSANAGSYTVIVKYTGGSCTSDPVTLSLENPPTVSVQPQSQVLCNNSITSATFSIAGTSTSAISYQWYKNNVAIPGATTSSFTATGLTYDDTVNSYYAVLTNGVGSKTSSNAGFKYLILSQPTPATAYLATGNTITFTANASSVASVFQWNKNGNAIAGAKGIAYKIDTVTTSSAGKYSLTVAYPGGTCTSNAAVLTTSVVLYSKETGNLRASDTWGVNTDGSGSTPVDFTRDEHTFIVANRPRAVTGGNLTIAGTLDVANANVVITPGSTLTAGRIIRSAGTTGAFIGSATSSLTVNGISNSAYAGSSDLYFKADADTLQNLTIAGHAVTLRNALNITAGSNPGKLQVNSGSFNTSDLLTLKSDASGTAIVTTSLGAINGKVNVERYIPARRAWRVMCAPVTPVGAPTINAAWQEGATSSTDNPHPGYGTHITYGSTADGFDQNPQKTFSMYYFNSGKWIGVPATNKTPVTSYPAYLFFIRGDRSYDITTTTSSTTPRPTILRTTGYLNQGRQPDVQVSSTGFTLVANPYASPIDFEKVYNGSSNIKHTLRVWDPLLAGVKGVGAYVTLDWDGKSYKATPRSAMTNIIQPYQAFFIQSTTGSAGVVSINEAVKDIVTVNSPFGRKTARQAQDATLEINLNVFNDDSTTGIADGILYRFNEDYSNDIDDNDVNKFSNLYENLSIISHNTPLTIERCQMPGVYDTLHLNLTGTKTTSYQVEIIPQAFNKDVFLYDNYLKKLYPVSASDTNRFTISINTADALSKAANRFSIVMQNNIILPVTFSSAKAYAKGKTIQVEWNVSNEVEVQYYEVEKSANGTIFTTAGQVKATGDVSYSFNDAAPFDGNSYYRIKSVDKSGKMTYTKILPVTIDNTAIAGALSIYPNPLKGKSFQVQLSNKKTGIYTLELISNSGQQLFIQHINYIGGTAVFNVQLNNTLSAGLYFIKAIAGDGTTDVIKAIVQ